MVLLTEVTQAEKKYTSRIFITVHIKGCHLYMGRVQYHQPAAKEPAYPIAGGKATAFAVQLAVTIEPEQTP